MLVLTGVVIGALLGAGVGLVKYIADPYNQLPAMTFWLLGSLAAASAADLMPLLGPVAFGILRLAGSNGWTDRLEKMIRWANCLVFGYNGVVVQAQDADIF